MARRDAAVPMWTVPDNPNPLTVEGQPGASRPEVLSPHNWLTLLPSGLSGLSGALPDQSWFLLSWE